MIVHVSFTYILFGNIKMSQNVEDVPKLDIVYNFYYHFSDTFQMSCLSFIYLS